MVEPRLRLEQRLVAQLLPYHNNAKSHPADQVEAIAMSIRRFGFRDPIGITPDGIVIEGHGRLLAAELLGLAEVPVLVIDGLDPRQYDLYRIAHNRIALNTGFDVATLADELRDILLSEEEQFTFEDMGFTAEAGEYLLYDRGSQERHRTVLRPTTPAYDLIWDDRGQRGRWLLFMQAVRADALATGRTAGACLIDRLMASGVMSGEGGEVVQPVALDESAEEALHATN